MHDAERLCTKGKLSNANLMIAALCLPLALPLISVIIAVREVYNRSEKSLDTARKGHAKREVERFRSPSRRYALSELELSQSATIKIVEQNQRTSCFLSKRPLELRQAVYDLYYDGEEFTCDLQFRNSTTSSVSSNGDNGNLRRGVRKLNPLRGLNYRCEGYTGGLEWNSRYSTYSCDRSTLGFKVERDLLDLPLTCRQM